MFGKGKGKCQTLSKIKLWRESQEFQGETV